MTSVFVVEDHQVIRLALRSVIGKQLSLSFAGEQESGLDVIKSIAASNADVVLLDIFLPGVCGIEVAKQIRALLPQTKILIVSSSADPDVVLEALSCGVQGYFVKTTHLSMLASAIESVAGGSVWLDPGIRISSDEFQPTIRVAPQSTEVICRSS